jgi:hypothetical protein
VYVLLRRYWAAKSATYQPICKGGVVVEMECPRQECVDVRQDDRPRTRIQLAAISNHLNYSHPSVHPCFDVFFGPWRTILPTRRIAQEALFHLQSNVSTYAATWSHHQLRCFATTFAAGKLSARPVRNDGSRTIHAMHVWAHGDNVHASDNDPIDLGSTGEWVALHDSAPATNLVQVARIESRAVHKIISTSNVFTLRFARGKEVQEWHQDGGAASLWRKVDGRRETLDMLPCDWSLPTSVLEG